MKMSEVDELLRIISGFDRRPFPEGAARIWYEILQKTEFEDAKAAVVEYFTTGDDSLPTLLPGRVRTGAQRWRSLREASARPALPAAPPKPAAMTRSAAFLAARAEIAARLSASSERYHEKDPSLRPYKHRTGTLTRVT